jgi:hypothetical protein
MPKEGTVVNVTVAAANIRLGRHAAIRGTVRRELERIIDGRSTLTAVDHPLGFACFPLLRGVSPRGICLHVWDPGQRVAQLETSPYHCHSWDLLSYILYGSVGNQLITTRPGITFQTVTVRSESDGDTLIPTRQTVDIELHQPTYRTTGQFYTLPAGEFHASVRAGNRTPTATLVIGTRQPRYGDITLAGLDFTERRVGRPRFSAAHTHDIARTVLDRLATNSGRIGEPAAAMMVP